MSCPLCGDNCRCAEPRAFVSTLRHVDPDAPDDSEEQFAASLDASAPPPPRYNRIVMPEPEAEEPQLTSAVQDQFASAVHEQFALAPQLQGDPEMWRQEVADRVQSFRAKRRRRSGRANSMELDFDAPPAAPVRDPLPRSETRQREAAPNFQDVPPSPAGFAEEAFAPPVDPGIDTAAGYLLAAAVEPDPAPQTTVRWDGVVEEPEPRLPDVWNVIPFPGPADEATRGDELAEPVINTPRILDAPEMVQHAIPTPMAEINLGEEQEGSQLAVEIDIPLQVAALPQRVFGGVVDLLVVLAGMALFALIVFKISGAIAASKPVLAAGLAVPCFFWIAYQYMFLVHGGATPGMQFARLALTGFEEEPVVRRSRRMRALAMALSSVSLGLGFIWALVDEDTLCWHDRITRTYPIQVNK